MSEMDKRLCTVKEACKKTGLSKTFIHDLFRQKMLTKYKLGKKAVLLSMAEFESLASPNIKTESV